MKNNQFKDQLIKSNRPIIISHNNTHERIKNPNEKKIEILEEENSKLKQQVRLKEEIILNKNKEIKELQDKIKYLTLQKPINTNISQSHNYIDDEEAAIIESLVESEINDPIREYEDNVIRELWPDPDHMTYDQIIELQEKIGSVSRGLTKIQIEKLSKSKYIKGKEEEK